jgi:hypothetical protein
MEQDTNCDPEIIWLTCGPAQDALPWPTRVFPAAMIPRLAWAAVRTTPMPYRLLKLAEVYA